MRVAVGDTRLFFDVDGAKVTAQGSTLHEKPTLLLLHGGPGFDHSHFKPWFAALQDLAQIIYLDHRGNGRSDPDAIDRLTLDRWGDDVRAFCDALEIRSPIVLGVSFGGFVAQAYATRHPDHPRALILCNTAARYHEDRVLGAFERLGGAVARDAAAAFFHDASPATLMDYARVCVPLYNRRPPDPDFLARGLLHARFDVMVAFFAREYRTFDFRTALSRVRCPTLVLSGEDDPITPADDGADIAAALPPDLVRFERFAGCGHPIYQDDEEGFFRVLRTFIASVADRPG